MAHGNPYQSCLIPYEQEIFNLRRARGRKKPASYEKIANLLCDKYQINVNRQAVFKFVKVRLNLHKIGESTDTGALIELRRQPFMFDGKLTRLTTEEADALRKKLRKETEIEGLTIEDIAGKIVQLEDEIARIKKENARIKDFKAEPPRIIEENSRLKKENDQLKSAKEENGFLKEEIERLKEEAELLEDIKKENYLARIAKQNDSAVKSGLRIRKLESEVEQRKKETAALSELIRQDMEEIARLKALLKEETARMKKEADRREALEKESAALRGKLAAEQTARQNSLSWKVRKLISG